MFFTVSGILFLNCLNRIEDLRLGTKCVLNTPTIFTQQKLNIVSNLSIMLRGVNVELVNGIDYTYVPGVSSNKC